MSCFRFFGVSSRLLSVAALFGAVAFFNTAAAQELRIGYVNFQRLLSDSAPAQAAMKRLEGEFSKRDRDLQDAGNRFKTAAEKFEKDAPVMAESERVKRQRELAEQERELQRRARELREDFNQRRTEETQQMTERAQKIVKQLAEQEKVDLVVTDALYFSPRADLTDKVLRALNGPAAAGK